MLIKKDDTRNCQKQKCERWFYILSLHLENILEQKTKWNELELKLYNSFFGKSMCKLYCRYLFVWIFAQLNGSNGCLQVVKAKQNSHGKTKETIDPIPLNKTLVLLEIKQPYKHANFGNILVL